MERRIRDLEAQVQAHRQAQQDLERELRKFRGLYDLAIAMTSDQSVDDTLQLIVNQCCRLLQTDVSYITLQDESRGGFFKHTSTGIRTEAFKKMRLPAGMGLAGMVAEAGRGYRVADYLEETPLDAGLRAIIAAEGIVSGMAAPVQMASRQLGLLYVFNRRRTVFSQSDLETLSLIGNLAAVEISRKDAEKSLRESEERFRFMAETTGDVIYRLRYDSMSYDYLSPGIQKLTGYTTQEINALGFSRLVTRIDFPDQEDVQPRLIAQERQQGKVGEYRADYLITSRSGEKKWLRDHSFPWYEEAGRVVGSVGILSDVSEYKRAEALVRERTEELSASEKKFRTLVENVPLVVYRLKPDGEILFVNQFVEDLFGYTPSEIISNPGLWSETLHEKDRPYVEAQREKIYRGGQELITEYRVKHKQGHLVDVIDHAIPLRGPEGEIRVVDGIIMDITWMVRLHERLIRDEGLKTISEVSSRLAHEIRNPLVSAGGFARRLLSSMSPDDPNRAKVEIIVKEVARLEAILRMMLNYLQPLELNLLPVDLNALIQGTLETLQGNFARYQARLEVYFGTGLPTFPGDAKLLTQALESLLINALRQMPQGSTLVLRTIQDMELLELMVRYPAPHLSADDAEHFFYPFTTFRSEFEAVDLPMCKIIINKHDGAIQVDLDSPESVVIRISFPLRNARPQKVRITDK